MDYEEEDCYSDDYEFDSVLCQEETNISYESNHNEIRNEDDWKECLDGVYNGYCY